MYITNILKDSNIQIAYRTNNTLQSHFTHNIQNPEKFSLSRVYKLTCPDYKKAYIGQTGRDLITRYNERKCSFQNNNHTSKFAQHLIEHMHYFGNIYDIMQILQLEKKVLHLNTIE
jgi:hypothetical protein